MSAEETPVTDSRYAATLVTSHPKYSKEQNDIALAALVLRSGVLTERQLSQALTEWTIHGSVPLIEHLVALELLDSSKVQKLSEQIVKHLEESCDAPTSANGSPGKSVLLSTLDALDPSGTVARLMGIRAVAGTGASDSTGGRQAAVRYQFVRKLGQGGLGRVWLAFDHHLKRHVAVKEITIRNNPAALERFRREAEITAQLEHPGIVPIYQMGDDSQTGEVFYAMRFLGKRTFQDGILEYHERRAEGNDEPMLIRQLLMDFVNICQAIGHAHSRKVIHRDLKPENVAIDNFGQVIVIDWGIAKVLDELHQGDRLAMQETLAVGQNSTMEGQVLGTPLYMAPEQAAGRIDELDERTDIYGLGGILFAILSGYAPHERTREVANVANNRELLTAIAAQPTPNVCDINPNADRSLAAICAKAMARRRYLRYQSASQLAEDVQRWMAGEPVSAYREKPFQRLTRWIKRHQILSQVIAVSLTVGVVALATWGIASHQNQAAQRQIQFDEMRGYEREIRLRMNSFAERLAQNTKFMADLPAIQALIHAQSQMKDDEAEEIRRLELMFTGLLHANPHYLSIAFAMKSAEDKASDMVRVERHSANAAFVRVVPKSRLGEGNNLELFQQTVAHSLGESVVMIQERSTPEAGGLKDIRMLASTPVYDEATGDLFGTLTIELDLLNRIALSLDPIEMNATSIYITNSQGDIWVSEEPQADIEVATSQVNVAELIPEAAEFFSGQDQRTVMDRSQGWIVGRIVMDPANPDQNIGVVLQLKNED